MSMLDVTQAGARMVTPCNHFFHTTCLQRWLGVKLQCPTCRWGATENLLAVRGRQVYPPC